MKTAERDSTVVTGLTALWCLAVLIAIWSGDWRATALTILSGEPLT